MNLRVLIAVLILGIPVAWYAGYLVGKSVYTERDTQVSVQEDTSKAQAPQTRLSAESLSNSSGQNTAPREDSDIAAEQAAPAYEDSDNEMDASQSEVTKAANDLETTGKMLAMRPEKEHSDLRNNFADNFSPEDEDWQAKTHFTDFLQLHEHADLITLHKILCSTDRCQLIGQFDAEHKQWETVIEDMKKQDWWNYTGTSSSSSTRDGVTYFNLFVDKPAEP